MGSLILGGYDQSRIKGANGTFPMASSTSPGQTLLNVRVSSLTMGYGNGSSASLTTSSDQSTHAFDAILDSTLPYLYLPDAICDTLVSSLDLSYDDFNNVYYWKGTQPDGIDQFVFTLVDAQQGDATTSITLPFAAFNLNTSWPILDANNESFSYFPIRKAPDQKTFILGRAFFQEAYVIADYERNTFTVAQAAFPTDSSSQLTPIFNTTFNPASSNSGGGGGDGGKKGLSGGAIAGIVIGVLAGVAIIAAIAWFLWRRKKKVAADDKNAETQAAEFQAAQDEKLGQQANRDRRDTYDTILSGETSVSHEMSAFPLEQRPSHRRHVSELSSDSEKTVQNKLRTPSAIYEMPDTSYMSANEVRVNSPSPQPVEALSREISTRTAQDAPSPMLSALSPASAREPLTAVSEAPVSAGVPSPPTSPTPTRQLSQTPTRGTSRFSERSSDMQP